MENIVLLIPRKDDYYYSETEYLDFNSEEIIDNEKILFYKIFKNKLFLLKRPDYSTINIEYWSQSKLSNLDKHLKKKFPQSVVYVAIHWGGKENSDLLRDYIIPHTNSDFKLKNGSFYLTFFSDNNDHIAEKKYDELYNFIIKRIETLSLEYQKKTIISLWLPLAIDIQGLSEIQHNSKIKDYSKKIEKDIDAYAESLIDKWKEIKNILIPTEGNDGTNIKYRLNEEDKQKVIFPIEKNGKVISAASLKEFIRENYKHQNDSDFLPNWLTEVVRMLEKKIVEESK